jgi:hypothetical protein
VSGSDFADPHRWRPAGTDGLVTFRRDSSTSVTALRPVDTPYPLPFAGTADNRLAGLDGQVLPAVRVAHLAGLPSLGASGALIDLEYADRLAGSTDSAVSPQVWLGPAAPPDAVDRLRAAGLVVIGDRQLGAVRGALDGQASALALWFHLVAAGFAVLLAAGGTAVVATVDRRRRAADLAVLRAQGVSRRTTDRAGLLTHVLLVGAAVVVGLVAAALGWALSGRALPLFADTWTLWPRPSWPQPLPVLGPWLAAAAVLLAAGAAAAADLRRAVRRAV